MVKFSVFCSVKEDDPNDVKIDDYTLHVASMIENLAVKNTARIVVYTKKDIISQRRKDLEDNRVASLWLEVGKPHQKKILLCNVYRECQCLDQKDIDSHFTVGKFTVGKV